MSLQTIEKEWDVSKILVTDSANPKYLSYVLGKHDIYVHKMHPIVTSLEKNLMQMPLVADLRSRDQKCVQDFIHQEKQFRAYKIFKHGEHFYELEDCVGLAANTVKNMLNLEMLPKPTTFYVDSNDKRLMKIFYEIAVRINEEDQLGHKFDFEEYDYKLLVKGYDTYEENMGPVYTGFSLFAILTGPNMPNAWNQECPEYTK